METVYRITAGCAVAVIMILTVKQRSGELAAVISLAACSIILWMCFDSVQTLFTWFQTVGASHEMPDEIISTVLKVCGIGVFSQFASMFCQDAGEGTLAKTVELCAGAISVCTMLPLVDSALTTVSRLLGG